MIRQEWDCSIEEANEKTANPVQGSTFPVSSGCGDGVVSQFGPQDRILGAMPTALRGHGNPQNAEIKEAVYPDMPTQSREHGTQLGIKRKHDQKSR